MMHITLLVLSILSYVVNAHEWQLGTCPNMQPMPNVSIKKFLGEWYIIEQFDTTSKCLKFTYREGDSETNIKVTKSREFPWIDSLGVAHTSGYTGSLDIPFAENQGFMRVKWPLNVAGKGDYYLADTDYVTYALVYSCQNVLNWFSRENAAILSRDPTLDQIIIDKMKRKLEGFSIDVSHFNKISHANCRNESDAKVKLDFDEDTLSNVFNTATDTVKDAAKEAAKGIEGVATRVSQTFSESEQVKEGLREKIPKK